MTWDELDNMLFVGVVVGFVGVFSGMAATVVTKIQPLEMEVIRLEALVENLERRKQPAPIATDVVLSVPTTDDRIQVSGVGLVYATCLVKADSGEYIPIEEWLADIEAAE